MKTRAAWFAALWLLPSALVAQTPAVPTMDHEPHHHLALHNGYVKVFNVEVAPGDSIILHSHDQDTIAIAIGDQLVTVGIPGKTTPAVQECRWSGSPSAIRLHSLDARRWGHAISHRCRGTHAAANQFSQCLRRNSSRTAAELPEPSTN